ncbi:MAG: ArgE/DapE family deacylase [Candidatus Bathyarchaeota archaeon]|nr:ArgE/DapE family deacylase [Candidatus Bathyarchaeota archaeon]
MYEDLLKKLDDRYTVKKLEEMIAIPSVVKEEKELAHYLQAELDELGYKTELQDVEPGRPNVYAKLKGKAKGKRLNFCGHMDTVPVVVGWETDPFKPVKKGNRLHGLGSNDMKGGIACTLNMLRAFAESGQPFSGELSFAGVIDEEAYGEGAKAMLKTEYGKVDAVVLGEPTTAEQGHGTPLGITGKVLYDIYVNGKAAHGFDPGAGINAVEEAGIILANLPGLEFKKNPNFGQGNYSTLKIEGGYTVYSVVVPATCRIEVNRLLVPGETAEYAVKDMERLIKGLKLKSSVEVKTKAPLYASYEIKKSEPIVKVFDEAYREVFGVAPEYGYHKSITDANTITGEGGIPCIHLGPKPGGTHQKNEYVELDWLPRVSKAYALMAAKFLS